MKKIICLLSIFSLLLCACSPNNNDSSVSNIDITSNSISSTSSSLKDSDTVSKDSESSFVSLVTDDIPTDPGYLPLSYMYAINLDNGGKVTPGMTREEVEKVFPYPKKGYVKIEDLFCDDVMSYTYGGINFSYTYEDILESVTISNYITGSDEEKNSWFNCKVAGMQYTDLKSKTYEDIIELFGEPSSIIAYGWPDDEDYDPTNFKYLTYHCKVENERLFVIPSNEWENDIRDEEKYVHICFKLTDYIKFKPWNEIKIQYVEIYDY